MKNLRTFNEFINEDKFNQSIFEGTLAKKGSKELSDINLEDQMDNADDDNWRKLYQAISDSIGDDPINIIQVDSETNEDDPLMSKIYDYLTSNFSGVINIETDKFKTSHGWQVMHDPKLNVVRLDDNGFEAFFFSAKSNF